ncbi:hypothetical protein [Nocardiopsis sp. NRRL B-16309]|uniref:hypothetical protein n=1 Tax=Nocardiopsis sp. NRRL B-16309 TaxID=1519494 RepID=UPI0006AF37AE|nr:hypothetical protein [Nocardiopsis sp. NRRL B-16309]KOX15962.1 hypothetical protein ADL05_13230 [Nocardiopsis sp. NRRL B-16309]
MKVHQLALPCLGALLVLASVTACEGVNHKSCRNGDCTVVVVDEQWSGDLRDAGNTEYEFEVYMAEDQSAEVIVVREEGSEEEQQSATLQPGGTAELFFYSVEYVSHTDEEGATFQFTPS